MSRNLLAVAGLALVLPFAAAAAERNMSYDFVEFGYADLDLGAQAFAGPDDELAVSGLQLAAGYELSDFIFLTGSYDDLGGDANVSVRRRSFGAGMAFGIGDRTDMYATVSYLKIGLTHAELEDSGLAGELGMRRMVGSRSELFASAGYSSIFDDSDTLFSVGGRYWLSDGFAVSLAYQDSELGGSGIRLAGRFNF